MSKSERVKEERQAAYITPSPCAPEKEKTKVVRTIEQTSTCHLHHDSLIGSWGTWARADRLARVLGLGHRPCHTRAGSESGRTGTTSFRVTCFLVADCQYGTLLLPSPRLNVLSTTEACGSSWMLRQCTWRFHHQNITGKRYSVFILSFCIVFVLEKLKTAYNFCSIKFFFIIVKTCFLCFVNDNSFEMHVCSICSVCLSFGRVLTLSVHNAHILCKSVNETLWNILRRAYCFLRLSVSKTKWDFYLIWTNKNQNLLSMVWTILNNSTWCLPSGSRDKTEKYFAWLSNGRPQNYS